MPSKSKKQQKFMGMVRAYQNGELSDSEVSDKVKKAAKSMSKKDVEDYASTKHKDLPEKVRNEIIRKLQEYGKDAFPADTDLKKADEYELDSDEEVDVDESWFQSREGNDYKAKMYRKRDHSDTENFDAEYSGHPDIEELKEHHMHLIARDADDMRSFIKTAFVEYPNLEKNRETVEKLVKYYTTR